MERMNTALDYAIGEIGYGNGLSGGVGAVVGELTAEYLGSKGHSNQAIIGGGKISGAIAAMLTGADADGVNAADNNYLAHQMANKYIVKESEVYDKLGREIGNDVVDATKTVGKLGYATGVEMTPARVIIRTVIGHDPYDNRELSSQERVEEAGKYIIGAGFAKGAGKLGGYVSENVGNRAEFVVEIGQGVKPVIDGYGKMDKKN